MHAIRRQPQRAPDGAPVYYERHRPEQTELYRLVQQHAASFIAQTEASSAADLPRTIKDEFDAFLECGILAHGFLRLRCGECDHDKLLAPCKRRGFCPSCGAPDVADGSASGGPRYPACAGATVGTVPADPVARGSIIRPPNRVSAQFALPGQAVVT